MSKSTHVYDMTQSLNHVSDKGKRSMGHGSSKIFSMVRVRARVRIRVTNTNPSSNPNDHKLLYSQDHFCTLSPAKKEDQQLSYSPDHSSILSPSEK